MLPRRCARLPARMANVKVFLRAAGVSELAFRRSAAVNAYDALVVAAFLRASGRELALPSNSPQPVTRVLPESGTETTFLLSA